MVRRIGLFAILLLFFLPYMARSYGGESENKSYAYSNMNLGASLVIDESRHAVLSGDTGVKAKFCDKSTALYCVESELLSFAVPRELARDKAYWTRGEYRYDVLLPLTSKKLFGRILDITAIGQSKITDTDHKTIRVFYFSPKYGLLAFAGHIEMTPEDRRLYSDGKDFPIVAMISSEAIGFGANE